LHDSVEEACVAQIQQALNAKHTVFSNYVNQASKSNLRSGILQNSNAMDTAERGKFKTFSNFANSLLAHDLDSTETLELNVYIKGKLPVGNNGLAGSW